MRTTISSEIASCPVYRTDSAQESEAKRSDSRFPVAIKHRQAIVKIYRKTENYPFYRIA